MANSNSQEQTIYRYLSAQLQLGFYDNGHRFPTAKEIAEQFGSSYCPVQRALKTLEKEGLIQLCRGQQTLVLKKPCESFLQSSIFNERLAALPDLIDSLTLISPEISLQGLFEQACSWPESPAPKSAPQWRQIYGGFQSSLKSVQSRTVQSLYCDLGAFLQSTFVDVIRAVMTPAEETQFLSDLAQDIWQCRESLRQGALARAKEQMRQLNDRFFAPIRPYIAQRLSAGVQTRQIAFRWTPYKGRTRYCDLIALDLISKFQRDVYPNGTWLPNTDELADLYHVSAVTIRRTIGLLNQMGFTKTFNGIGTQVVQTENSAVVQQLNSMNLDGSLRAYLEALQLLAMTCEPVIAHCFSQIPASARQRVQTALETSDMGAAQAAAATIGARLYAVVQYSPLAAIREIYRKLTMQLLNGNTLPYDEFKVPASIWPERASQLAQALKQDDAGQFAHGFRHLIEDNFQAARQSLLRSGMQDVKSIAAPILRRTE